MHYGSLPGRNSHLLGLYTMQNIWTELSDVCSSYVDEPRRMEAVLSKIVSQRGYGTCKHCSEGIALAKSYTNMIKIGLCTVFAGGVHKSTHWAGHTKKKERLLGLAACTVQMYSTGAPSRWSDRHRLKWSCWPGSSATVQMIIHTGVCDMNHTNKEERFTPLERRPSPSPVYSCKKTETCKRSLKLTVIGANSSILKGSPMWLQCELLLLSPLILLNLSNLATYRWSPGLGKSRNKAYWRVLRFCIRLAGLFIQHCVGAVLQDPRIHTLHDGVHVC